VLVKKTRPFDKVLGSIERADVVLLAGPPGTGKSDLLLAMAGSMTTDEGVWFLAGERPWNPLLDGSRALRGAGPVAKRLRRG